MPTRRFQPLKAKDTQTDQAYSEISQVIDALAPLEQYALRTEARVSAASPSVLRLGPRAAGQEVVIPTASGANFNQTITLFVQNALGTVRVRASSGTINGATAFTLAAGYTTVVVLRSGGDGKWMTERASGFPVAGDSLAYSGETLNYTGTTSILALTGITGNQGTVDISSVKCGGAVCVIAPTGDWQIEGFTSTPVKPDGFWFCFAVASTNFVGTIFNEDATAIAADRIRTINEADVHAAAIQAFVHKVPSNGVLGGSPRWRFVAGVADNIVQRQTAGGTLDNLTLNASTRILQIDSGNTAWSLGGLTGGWAGRKITVENASNTASTGSILSQSAGSSAANQIITPGNVTRGGYNRYGAELEYDAVDSFWRIVSDVGPNEGRLLARTVYTSGTGATHNHATGARFCIVRMLAGGSGGTGATLSTAGNIVSGTPGASGAYGERTITLAATSSTYTVGGGGAGGSAAGGVSGIGNNTTWTHNAVVSTVFGGGSSAILMANGLSLAVALGASASGAATNCDLATVGQGGEPSVRLSGTVAWTGKGGSSSFGDGGAPRSTSGAGTPATGFGAGGGAGLSINAAAAVAGGAGTGGFIIVEDYA